MTFIKILKRTFIILLPFGLLFAFSGVVLWRSGEAMDPDKLLILANNSSKPVLYGKAFNQKRGPYRVAQFLKNDPSIISLGSSRVMQFRKEFFNPEQNFFCLGIMSNIHYLKIVPELLEKSPNVKTIILGIDPWWFNDGYYQNKTIPSDDDLRNNITQFNPDKSIYRDKLLDVAKYTLEGKINPMRLLPNDSVINIGLMATMSGSGIRPDGSRRYGKHLAQSNDDLLQEDLELLDFYFSFPHDQLKKPKYESGSCDSAHISEQILADFLSYCKEKKINVIGFIGPYHPQVLEKMRSMPNSFSYIDKSVDITAQVFTNSGFKLYSYLDLAKLDTSIDPTYVDGCHASEKTYAQILLDLAQKDSIISTSVNIVELESKINTSKSELSILPN